MASHANECEGMQKVDSNSMDRCTHTASASCNTTDDTGMKNGASVDNTLSEGGIELNRRMKYDESRMQGAGRKPQDDQPDILPGGHRSESGPLPGPGGDLSMDERLESQPNSKVGNLQMEMQLDGESMVQAEMNLSNTSV